MRLLFIMCQARGQVVLYITSEINRIVYISLPERSLAQEKLRVRLSTCASYFLRKGLLKGVPYPAGTVDSIIANHNRKEV